MNGISSGAINDESLGIGVNRELRRRRVIASPLSHRRRASSRRVNAARKIDPDSTDNYVLRRGTKPLFSRGLSLARLTVMRNNVARLLITYT